MSVVDPLQANLDHVGRLLRQAAPRDLAGMGVYLVPSTCGPEAATPESVMAWTNANADLVLQSYLESRGRWRGRGFAAVFSRQNWERECKALSVCGLLATSLHELAHWLLHPAPIAGTAAAHAADKRKGLMLRATSILAIDEGRSQFVNPTTRPKWHAHEHQWIRAAIHLAAATRKRVGFNIQTASLQVAGDIYGLSDVDEYEDALAAEPTPGFRDSFRDLLSTPAPPEFIELWNRDTGASATAEPAVVVEDPPKPETFSVYRRDKKGRVYRQVCGGNYWDWYSGKKTGWWPIAREEVKE